MTKIGLIGAGQWSTKAAAGALRHGMTISGVYAPDDTAKALVEKLGGNVAASPTDVFTNCDAVLIGSPTDTHADYIQQAAAAGKPTLVSSPIANAVDAADAAGQAGAGRIAASFPFRFRPEYGRLKTASDSGQLGDIGIVRLGVCLPAPTDWRSDASRSGGPLVETGVHVLDYLAWAFGPIERVYGLGSESGARNYHVLTGRLVSGAIFHLEISWAEAAGVSYDYYEVAGSKGLLEFDSRRNPVFLLEGIGDAPGADTVSAAVGAQPADYEMQEFALFCQGKPSKIVEIDEAVKGLQTALRVAVAVRSGEVVVL